ALLFLGTHTPRLDEKGRLFLPAKYRDELSSGLVLTKGQERCLYVFPEPEFGRITEALRTAPVTAKAVRDYSRVFFVRAPAATTSAARGVGRASGGCAEGALPGRRAGGRVAGAPHCRGEGLQVASRGGGMGTADGHRPVMTERVLALLAPALESPGSIL